LRKRPKHFSTNARIG